MSPDNQNPAPAPQATPTTPPQAPAAPATPPPAAPSAPATPPPATSAPATTAPASQSPGSPASQAPGSPSSQAPGSPASQSPGSPASQSPGSPASQAPGSPAPQATCKCQTINPADWDKKKTTINKTFFKAFSPRLFYYPFSFVIDVLRATKGAQAKNYKVVENGMIIDDCAMFLGNIMIEVTGANTNDSQVLSLEGKEVYTKVSRNDWKNIRLDIAELEKELGKKPAQLLVWWTSCPTCTANKEAKAVLIALP